MVSPFFIPIDRYIRIGIQKVGMDFNSNPTF